MCVSTQCTEDSRSYPPYPAGRSEDLMIVKTMMVIMNMVRTTDNRYEPWVRIVMIKCSEQEPLDFDVE